MLRSARQIKLDKKILNNHNVSVKIGTIENRNNPETIYIETSFWIQPKNSEEDTQQLNKKLLKKLKDIYLLDLSSLLDDNYFFPKSKENLYIVNTPENVNYNNKKNFISIELYLHTINLFDKSNNFPLSKKSPLFDESLKIANKIVTSDILSGNSDFLIFNRK